MTVQDAIDLGEYFIDTSSAFHRYANDIPTVGGETDP